MTGPVPIPIPSLLKSSSSWLSSLTADPPFPPLPIAPGLSLPRGRVSEVFGSPSSGRTTFLYAVLAAATARQEEVTALVDVDDRFDPASAAAAGVVLHRLLWIRCGCQPERALRVTDLVLQAGGFGLVAIDVADTAPMHLRRIPPASWYRFRNAVERTRTVFLVVSGEQPSARQCATASFAARRKAELWSGAADVSRLWEGFEVELEPRKPAGQAPVGWSPRVFA